MTFQPSIHLNSIFNTVFNSSLAVNPNGTPPVSPTVSIIVNGQLNNLNILSTTAQPVQASEQAAFPIVGTTGRTAVTALGIQHLNVTGSAHNLTVGRTDVPFQRGFSGLNKLGSATFGGNADAVSLDVSAGKIGHLNFKRGLGNPAGQVTSVSQYGYPAALAGYPSFGLLGGVVAAQQIGTVKVGEASPVLIVPEDPSQIQYPILHTTNYIVLPGTALTSAVIASAGSIGATNIAGSATTSEIIAGFDYPAFVAGLEATRRPRRSGRTPKRATSSIPSSRRVIERATTTTVVRTTSSVPARFAANSTANSSQPAEPRRSITPVPASIPEPRSATFRPLPKSPTFAAPPGFTLDPRGARSSRTSHSKMQDAKMLDAKMLDSIRRGEEKAPTSIRSFISLEFRSPRTPRPRR